MFKTLGSSTHANGVLNELQNLKKRVSGHFKEIDTTIST